MIDTVCALLPPQPDVPKWAAERRAVGDRAEMYIVQYERSRIVDATRIIWVSRDTDSLGWDVEDRSVTPIAATPSDSESLSKPLERQKSPAANNNRTS
jgi:hypothetical protein